MVTTVHSALLLVVSGSRYQALHPPGGRARFAGEDPVTGEPLDGRAVALNLMWRRDAVDAEVLHRPLVGPMLFFTGATETWLLYVLAGLGTLACVLTWRKIRP